MTNFISGKQAREIDEYNRNEMIAFDALPERIRRCLNMTGVSVSCQILVLGLKHGEFTEADVLQAILARAPSAGRFRN